MIREANENDLSQLLELYLNLHEKIFRKTISIWKTHGNK